MTLSKRQIAACLCVCISALQISAQTDTAPVSPASPTAQQIVSAPDSSTVAQLPPAPDAVPPPVPAPATPVSPPVAVVQPEASAAVVPVEIPEGVLFGTFAKGDGPFLLTGSIVVPAGQTLEFGPGCIIYVGGKYSTITVFGQIIARGTKDEPVVFMSANKSPNPWDWDRIYVRSRNQSVFEHVVVKHSNYGIYAENASVSIANALFEQNSLHAIVAKNADVSIRNVTIRRGHVLALFCQPGSSVAAESLVVRDNNTAIACDAKSSLSLLGSTISNNNIGISIRNASVTALSSEINANHVGIASEFDIPRKMREMVFANDEDVRIVSPVEMDKILKAPEMVRAVSLPKSTQDIAPPAGFSAGFSALAAPREATASLIGNVGLGANYYRPHSFKHPTEKTVYNQNKFIGENDISGMQPDMSIFLQGKNADADISLNADLAWNEWVDRPLHMKANQITLGMNYGTFAFTAGDFYENFSEITASNRKMRGGRFTGGLFDMGRGEKRVTFHLAAGETEHAKPAGSHELDVLDTVAAGSDVRQQFSYVAQMGVKPLRNLTIGAKGLIAHDQADKGIGSLSIPDSIRPLETATGALDAALELLKGRLNIGVELSMGARDTVEGTVSRDTSFIDMDTAGIDTVFRTLRDYSDIAWYNPAVGKSISRVFGLINPGSENYAFNVDAKWTPGPIDISASYQQIAPHYASAGNPYLEADRRRADLRAEKQISEQLALKSGYIFEETGLSGTLTAASDSKDPVFYHTLNAGSDISFGEAFPSFTLDWEGKIMREKKNGLSSDTVYETDTIATTATITETPVEYHSFEMSNVASIDLKQRFGNGMDYGIKYAINRKNDRSDYPDAPSLDKNDAWEHALTLKYQAKIAKIVTNRITVGVSVKTRIDNDLLKREAKISDNLKVTILPRVLTLTLKGDYQFRRSLENSDTTVIRTVASVPTEEIVTRRDPVDRDYRNLEGELRWTMTSKLSGTLSAKYERSEDATAQSKENYTVKVGGLHFTYLF